MTQSMENKLEKKDPPAYIIPSVEQAQLLNCSKKINTIANTDISKLTPEEQGLLLEKAYAQEQFEYLLSICQRVIDD